jgi:hypothetical protein
LEFHPQIPRLIMLAWLWSESTPRTATPPPDPYGYITACVSNEGHDGLRLRVWINGELVDDKIVGVNKIGCGGSRVAPGTHDVSIACDDGIDWSHRVTVADGQFADIPSSGRAYVCT